MAVVVKLPAIVIKAEKHTADICTLTLKPLKPFPAFKPGQFLHLALDAYDPSYPWPESRVFSIASSPLKKDIIRLTFIIKGSFTRRMYADLKENDTVWLKLPYGEFIFDTNAPSVLVAGGTGITPYIALLETLCENNNNQAPVQLHYGLREPEQVLYKELLHNCSQSIKKFQQYVYVENPGLSSSDDYIKGKIDIENIYTLNRSENFIYYLSGPNEMIKSFRNYLKEKGVASSHIRVDEWM